MQGKWPGLKALRYGLLLAVSVATLSGCVSAVSTDMRADNKAAQENEETVAEGSTDETTTPVVTADAAQRTAQDPSVTADAGTAAGGQVAGEEAGRDMAGLVMQQTTLNAGQSSIYANGGQAGNAYATQTSGTNASVKSLYAGSGGAQGADQSGRLPVEDMPTVESTGQQPLETLGDQQAEVVLPENVPIPKTARTALVAEAATGNAADLALAVDDNAALPETTTQAGLAETQTKGKPRKTVTLASLFASKREAKDQFDGDRFAEQPRRVINRDSASATQKASLGRLPGVSTANALFSTEHSESEEVEDDAPQFKEVASLAGLARLAPNGLWLQTEKVKTGCFKPELLQVLKTIEKHYDKPIIVTSGLRDMKRNRAKQSLHTRCEAADIQISGVGKWELAEYLRSMPGRGGVGTYCHTESVHIDVGPERDWNWRCRRRK
ncbi:YcbK family protein [Shinella sp.]|uniref:YcbK family protein n=1 Tax=Shinella sp. TaxID=1870904 RepID=UPI0029A7F062|nr:YcbK family protein [Shinella sp.]MDX3976076.1 YcbK family protein [Shinella sp.]